MTTQFYNSNPNLKAAYVSYQYTQAEVDELKKCANDPIYFIETYVKVVHPDLGLIPLKLYAFQKDMIMSYWKNKKTISLTGRQMGKSTVAAAFFCWYTIFNDDKTCAVLANKAAVARDILARYQLAYEHLPKFIQQGVITWNKGSVELENGSKVIAAGTSSSAIRGFVIQVLYLDEFAFVQPNIAEEFFTSVYPTLSAGQSTKLIITSTPNGFNHYWKLWNDAELGENGFNPIHVTWEQVPWRDEAWKQDQLKTVGAEKFAQEHETEFLGSVNTLIPAKYIKAMSPDRPLHKSQGLTVYAEPVKFDPLVEHSFDHSYAIVCDPAEGTGNDDSAFVVFDITSYPIRIVATYADNNISPLVLPTILERIGLTYNNASILIETNNNGKQVADILWRDIEYENVVMLSLDGHMIGVRTDKRTKRLGCTLFKDMVESQKLLINDTELITQISNFVQKKQTYMAADGYHDDLVMCCVLLGYFSTTEEFKNISNTNFRKELKDHQMSRIEEDILPFGFVTDGTETPEKEQWEDFWTPVGQGFLY